MAKTPKRIRFTFEGTIDITPEDIARVIAEGDDPNKIDGYCELFHGQWMDHIDFEDYDLEKS